MTRKDILPPTYFFAAIIIMLALYFLFPIKKVIPSPYNYFGVLIILIGLMMNIWASRVFEKAETTVKPFEQSTCLITHGLYRFSRHPMYLGMVISLIGLLILLRSISPVMVVPVFIWFMSKKFIDIEEKDLEKAFGDDYCEYKKKVRRWI